MMPRLGRAFRCGLAIAVGMHVSGCLASVPSEALKAELAPADRTADDVVLAEEGCKTSASAFFDAEEALCQAKEVAREKNCNAAWSGHAFECIGLPGSSLASDGWTQERVNQTRGQGMP